MPDQRFRLSLPTYTPVTPDEVARINYELERWGNTIPLDLPNIQSYRTIPGVTSTTTSAVNVNWPSLNPLSGTFIKRYGPITKLTLEISAGAFADAANREITMGLQFVVNGVSTENDILVYFFNVGTDHRAFMGFREVLSLDAGVYLFSLRMRTTAGTISANSSDAAQFRITESLDHVTT